MWPLPHGWGAQSMLKSLKTKRLDRVEAAYLAILRVAVLAVATLCLVAAIGFAIDGMWRIAVSTDVEEQQTAVSAAEVISAMRISPPPRQEPGQPQISPAVRQAHAGFQQKVFRPYYAVYKRASDAYKKDEDKTLSEAELLAALGYDLDAYAAGSSLATKLFVERPDYQQQAQAAVAAAMSDPGTVRLLTDYKAAEKTAQSCSTITERRRVWDSNSTACSDWFYTPYGCEVTRNVPVQRCVPAYPDGIVSPIVAFGRADDTFRTLWADRADANAGDAALERSDRENTRAAIGPRLLIALQIIGGFLAVMFFFLIIAVERHLRKLAQIPNVVTENDGRT